MADFIVLGAGIAGVCTALELQSRNHSVIIVDKHAAGQKASYGNAGLIQVEVFEPFSFPRNLAKLSSLVLGKTNDLTWSMGGLFQNAAGLYGFYRNSAPKRLRQISEIYSNMAQRSTQDHENWIHQAGAEHLVARDGFVRIYRSANALEKAIKDAEKLSALIDAPFRALDGQEFHKQEPAVSQNIAGAVHWQRSWTCSDPGKLTELYANLFLQRGGEIVTGDAASLKQSKIGWQIQTSSGRIEAASAVIALGAWSPSLAKRFGFRVPMIEMRGYHAHYDAPIKLKRPLVDTDFGVVATQMTKGLRILSGIAVVGHGSRSNEKQLNRGISGVANIIELGQRVPEETWHGTRLVAPDMLPIVGQAPGQSNLWYNFALGHHGITFGPTSAMVLADQILGSDETKALQSALTPNRFM